MNLYDESPLILVVCTGNVCRSPMAEAKIRSVLGERRLGAQVISRGLSAPIGRPPHPFAIDVCAQDGVAIHPEKRAAQISSAEVSSAAIVLVMDFGHRQEMQRRYPSILGKTFLLGHWQAQEIEDPINQTLEVFESVWIKIKQSAEVWVDKMLEAGLIAPS